MNRTDSGKRAGLVAYGRDLAQVHHDHFGDVARQAAPTVLRELRRAHPRGGRVVDLGCGSGILARALTEAGYDVLGVDFSKDMLRLATRQAPDATFVRASLLEADLPPCIAVTAIGECLNYAFDPRNSLAGLVRLFRRIHRALQPGGVLIFDIIEPGRLGRSRVKQLFHDREDWSLYLHAVEDAARRTLTRDITLFRKVGKLYRRSDERHLLHLYRRGEIAEQLARAGFRVRALRGYGTLRFDRGWAGFLATKAR